MSVRADRQSDEQRKRDEAYSAYFKAPSARHENYQRAIALRAEIASLEARLCEARREFDPIGHLLMSRSEMMEDDRVYKD